MARHNVSFTIPERPLGKSDIEFTIRRNGEAFGTLKVSKGSIVWLPKKSKYGYKMAWWKFDQLMQQNATKREKR